MAPSLLEFLPPRGNRWLWADAVSKQIVTVPITWRADGARQILELGSVPGHPFKALFDRLIVSSDRIDVTRLRMQAQSFEMPQPLSAAIGAAGGRVTNVVPGLSTMIGMAPPPFDGVIVRSEVREAGESQWSRLTEWELAIAVLGRDGTVAMRATWLWLKDLGLASYQGDVYGSFFKYDHHPRLQFDGVWIAPETGVAFTFAQQGRAVTGGFTHAGFTGELKGTFDGTAIRFEWSTLPDRTGATQRGQGALAMDEDGVTLRGHFALNAGPADWLLLRTPPPSASVPTSVPTDFSTAIRAYHSRGGYGGGSSPHEPFRDWTSRTRLAAWNLSGQGGRDEQVRALQRRLRNERERPYKPVTMESEWRRVQNERRRERAARGEPFPK